MNDQAFDVLSRHLRNKSRRALIRVFVTTFATYIGGIPTSRARAQQSIPLGETCSQSSECRTDYADEFGYGHILDVTCGDNGFSVSRELACCVDFMCCRSDADCCGDLRCSPGYEVCPGFCTKPPFPTRWAGQVCSSHADCISMPGYGTHCVDQVCTFLDPRNEEWAPIDPDMPEIPDSDAAMMTAEFIAGLEVGGRLHELYRSMNVHAQLIIPQEAVIGWYEHEFQRFNEPAPQAIKVRFIEWTWAVTGQTFPLTAEVAMRQVLPDGTENREVMYLAKDINGSWGWFFGGSREFVAEQIARFVASPED